MDLTRRTIFRPIRHLGLALLLAVSTVAAEPQVTGLNVSHRSGQTFITWEEVDPPRLEENCDDAAIRQLARKLDDGKLHYRIYRGSNRHSHLNEEARSEPRTVTLSRGD